jgi:UDP-glucose 4-epimerase/UDP-glucuronate decarboxylase
VGEQALVTGGVGFLGLHLARRLLAEGYEVVLVDDLSRGLPDADLAEVLNHAQLVQLDLTEPWTDRRLAQPFDAVYHLAAVVGVGNVTRGPARTLRTNLLGTLNLTDWCRRHETGRLFFSSTSEVSDGASAAGIAAYPLPESVPFVLPDPWSSRSTYALSKMAGEAMLAHLGGATRVRIGRYHNAYGPRMGMSHVVPELTARLVRGDDPLTLPGADQRRAFCYVTDAIEATQRLMALDDPQPIVANIGNDTEEVTIAQLAAELCKVVGLHPAIQPTPAPVGSPLRRLPDLTVLRSRTGYTPAVSLAEGLRLTVAWYAR